MRPQRSKEMPTTLVLKTFSAWLGPWESQVKTTAGPHTTYNTVLESLDQCFSTGVPPIFSYA